jgi:hydrogenase maturation protease
MASSDTTKLKTLILGIGNLLMGDEGVGVHAVQAALEQESWPPDVTVLDGGTGGFHLLSYFQDYDRIIMVDATMDGQPSGTLATIRPRFASEFPRALSAHDIGLRDLIESASALGSLPEIVLITVSISDVQPMTTELSPEVSSSLPRIVERVKELVRSTGSDLEEKK